MVEKLSSEQSQKSLFIRVLKSNPEERGKDLLEAISRINEGDQHENIYAVGTAEFEQVPGSPFAYWVGPKIRSLFQALPPLESDGRTVKVGLQTGDDFRFVRAWWEVPPEAILDAANGPDWHQDLKDFQMWCRQRTYEGKRWVAFAKGGEYSPYYADIHLVVDWEKDGAAIKSLSRGGRLASRPQNQDFYFRPGLTYPRRLHRMIAQPLPAGTIISVRGSGIFGQPEDLEVFAGVIGSLAFDFLVKVLLGRFEYPQFDNGTLCKIPLPDLDTSAEEEIKQAVRCIIEFRRSRESRAETDRNFGEPLLEGLDLHPNSDLLGKGTTSELERIVDSIVFSAYGLTIAEQSTIMSTLPSTRMLKELTENLREKEFSNDDMELEQLADPEVAQLAMTTQETQDLLSYGLGVAYGRWDVRFALNHSLLPELQKPFDPLPVSLPGALVSPDGLPATPNRIVSEAWLRARPNAITLPNSIDGTVATDNEEYPLPIAWDGILVDDAEQFRDIVTAVRRVFDLVWGKDAGIFEVEACPILGYESLHTYFRDANKGFFDFHIRRYSKSRRKAPIYWLLQTTERNFGVWLYYHRLTQDTIFLLIQGVLDPKLALEEQRLEEYRTSLDSFAGGARKAEEHRIADQTSFFEELMDFKNKLEKVAALELKPNLNDGVLLNIAPLWELVPWKEAEKTWKDLLKGKYEWSSIGKQLRERGLVKG